MKIQLRNITIRDLVEGYEDKGDEGVVGYGGKLNIRPSYQRDFVYPDDKRNAVIESVRQAFPLNVMYWAKVDGQDAFEILDGQQRTVSISQFVAAQVFSIKDPLDHNHPKYFANLSKAEKEKILDYTLHVYVCEGSHDEKLKWFQTINISGMKLTDQELSNAIYAGTWTKAAKAWFGAGCPAAILARDYVDASPLRQELLEVAINWISPGDVPGYMAIHQHDLDAEELWTNFQEIIAWVGRTFPVKRKEIMKKVDWGNLWREHHAQKFNPAKLEEEIKRLMVDDDVTRQVGIYPFVLSRNEKHLNIRLFTESMRRAAFERQNGLCPACSNKFTIDQMEADHITPWSKQGKTEKENCQMLCKDCNRKKSNK